MKAAPFALALMLVAGPASASCTSQTIGSTTFHDCSGTSGTSSTIGGTTFHSGPLFDSGTSSGGGFLGGVAEERARQQELQLQNRALQLQERALDLQERRRKVEALARQNKKMQRIVRCVRALAPDYEAAEKACF